MSERDSLIADARQSGAPHLVTCEGGFHVFDSEGTQECRCGRFTGTAYDAQDQKPWLDAPAPERWTVTTVTPRYSSVETQR